MTKVSRRTIATYNPFWFIRQIASYCSAKEDKLPMFDGKIELHFSKQCLRFNVFAEKLIERRFFSGPIHTGEVRSITESQNELDKKTVAHRFEQQLGRYPANFLTKFPDKILYVNEGGSGGGLWDTMISCDNDRVIHHELFHWLETCDYINALPNINLYRSLNTAVSLTSFFLSAFLPTIINIKQTESGRYNIKYFPSFRSKAIPVVHRLILGITPIVSDKTWIDFSESYLSNNSKASNGFVRQYGKTHPGEDKATIAEMLFTTKKEALKEKLHSDHKLKAKVEVLTGCEYDPDLGNFTRLMTEQDLSRKYGVNKHYWFAKWSNVDGKVRMDAAYWNKVISENTGDFPKETDPQAK
jgi:hypothetical protein